MTADATLPLPSGPNGAPSGVATDPSVDPLVGHTLGGYRIVRLLGRGGIGAVYLGEHPVLRRQVAVKVIQGGAFTAPVALERFEREARLAAQLDHPNVVRVLHAGVERGMHFLVLELVEGESLADRLERRGKLSLAEGLPLMEQAARGLAEAHRHGIVHRDVKPGNLLVTPDGRLKITDLGLAKDVLSRSDITGSNIVGTPSFMSPEQVEARPADARTDLFALGATRDRRRRTPAA